MVGKLKILFVAQHYLDIGLGGPKVVMELAAAIKQLGHEVEVVGIREVENFLQAHSLPLCRDYALNIREYLKAVANHYDVLDVDANYLYAFEENNSHATPLIVARSVLFIPHLQKIKWPQKKTISNQLGDLLRRLKRGNVHKINLAKFYESLNKADLINVSNHKDVEQLLAEGYPPERIIELPYGLTDQKRQSLKKLANASKKANKIAFIGTFDFRKGCLDIPKIFAEVKKNIPDAELCLLGAKGLFQTEEKMFKFFPQHHHPSIRIIPVFKESDLPELLKDYKIGIFPSYLEGFGFSVIELMAAGIPLIAYDVPGPSSILSCDFLVPAGDWKGMAQKLIFLMKNEQEWQQAHIQMMRNAEVYDWHRIAKYTVDVYWEKSQNKRRMALRPEMENSIQ